MISGINLNEVVDFTLPDDKDNPTVWKLGMIPSGVLAQIGGMGKDNPIEVTIKLLQIGLKGWSNFEDIAYRTDKKNIYGQDLEVVPLELINRIPIKAIMLLSEKLIQINHLTDAERKNS